MVDTQPHGRGHDEDHKNPEYDTDGNGQVDQVESSAVDHDQTSNRTHSGDDLSPNSVTQNDATINNSVTWPDGTSTTTSPGAGAFDDTDADGTAELQDDHADFQGGDARNVGAFDAESVNGRIQLQSGDDAATVLDNATTGDRIDVEPGATFTLGFSPTVADGVTISAGGNWVTSPAARFLKGFNGAFATFGSGVEMTGIEWDGQKATYSGDGIVLEGTCNSNHWRGVRVTNNAGSGLVADGHYFNVFDACRFDGNDGYGAEFTEAAGHISQNEYRGWTQFDSNGKGGVHYDAATGATHTESYKAVVTANDGPGFYVHARTTRSWDVVANVSQNAGPPVVFQNQSGDWMFDQGSRWHLHVDGNAADMTVDDVTINGGTRDIGSVHCQSATSLATNLQLAGTEFSGQWRAGGETNVVSCYDSSTPKFVVPSGFSAGYTDLVFNPDNAADVSVVCPQSFISSQSGAGGGTVSTL